MFESGRFNPDGSIEGNDDYPHSRYEPHSPAIDAPGEVQIYEVIIAGPDGAVTTRLLAGLTYHKHNRLLPRGFDKGTASGDIALQGRALADPEFEQPEDTVRYAIPVGAAAGSFRIEASLCYRPIGYRWVRNPVPHDVFETDALFATTGRWPEGRRCSNQCCGIDRVRGA